MTVGNDGSKTLLKCFLPLKGRPGFFAQKGDARRYCPASPALLCNVHERQRDAE
jgi:hypothetical protein